MNPIIPTLMAFFAMAIAPLSAEEVEAHPRDQITVMSFNILKNKWQQKGQPGWDVRKKKVFSTIQDKNPDFVGTQEESNSQMADMLAALPMYQEVPGRKESGGILYLHKKWKLTDSGKTSFLGKRYFIWGLFTEKETNRKVYVYSNHLPHHKQAKLARRMKAIEMMATHAANRPQKRAPVILTGDFNSESTTDPMLYLTGEKGDSPIEFIYAYKDIKRSIPGKKWISYGVDHILVLPGTKVVESGVVAAIWDSGSDHPATFAVFEPWSVKLNGGADL